MQARSKLSPGVMGLAGRWKADLDPLMHIVEERSKEKLSLHLSQWMVLL